MQIATNLFDMMFLRIIYKCRISVCFLSFVATIVFMIARNGKVSNCLVARVKIESNSMDSCWQRCGGWDAVCQMVPNERCRTKCHLLRVSRSGGTSTVESVLKYAFAFETRLGNRTQSGKTCSGTEILHNTLSIQYALSFWAEFQSRHSSHFFH